MRLLHVSDLHFKLAWFDWVTKQSRDYDAVCVAGDMLNLFGTHAHSLRQQSEWVHEWIRQSPGRLFICSGNHDWWDETGGVDPDAKTGWLRRMGRPEVTVDGQSGECADFQFHCQGYNAPMDWPELPGERWILLQHVPPQGSAAAMSGVGGPDNGCPDLNRALRVAPFPPWLVLSGHIHRARSWRGRCGQSWVFNPMCDERAAFPNHVIIDTETGLTTWVSEREGTWPVKVLT